MTPKKNVKTNYIGIELECFGPNKNMQKFEDKVLAEPLLKNWVRITDDYSIRQPFGYRSIEILLLTSEKFLEKRLSTLLKILNKLKFDVNHSCGTHVHIDMRNRRNRIGTIYSNLVKCLPVLKRLQNKRRRDYHYCRDNKTSEYKRQQYMASRYQAINTTSFRPNQPNGKNTVEIRLHEGTLNFNDLYNWIKLLIKIVDTKSKIPLKSVKSINSLKKQFKLENDLTDQLRSRYNRYAEAA